MSHQRRRGPWVTIWRTVETEDRRGNKTFVASPVNSHRVRAAVVPDRSSKAEVPGQQQINVYKLQIPPLEDVTIYSRVIYDGKAWDIVTPPEHHRGSRRTEHWTLSIRERPNRGNDGEV